MKEKKILYPRLTMLIGAILLFVMLFLPFASMVEDKKERLQNYANDEYIEDIEMNSKDMINISLIKFAKVYKIMADKNIAKEISITCIVLISIYAAFSLITILFAVIKKPIGVIVFNLLTLGVFSIIHFDFKDRRVIPTSTYNWGITNYLTYIVGIGILVGAIIFIKERRKIKS